MFEDEYLKGEVHAVESDSIVVIRVQAKKNIVLTELQGMVNHLEELGITRPESFKVRQFGEDVAIPPEMADDVAFMNKSQFRWGFSIEARAGEAAELKLPASKPTAGVGVFTLAYKYPRLLGLSKGKGAIYVRVNQ